MRKGKFELNLTRVSDMDIIIKYRLPLSGEIAMWTTKEFVSFVRKYISFHMANINIIEITIKGNYNGTGK